MTKELNRVTLVILAVFLLIALSSTYWAVIQADSMLARPDNLRRIIQEQRIQRGTIFDRNGVGLAYSSVSDSGATQRIYPYPETVGAVGYYSFRYGTAGLEGAFDAELRGDAFRTDWQIFTDRALHRTARGGDVRSTLDLDVQSAATEAMGQARGAVIVAEVPSGRILAMVSRPSYNPNNVSRAWKWLRANKTQTPLLNRAMAGLYQPGGALQTIMLAAILSTYPDLTTTAPGVLDQEAPDAQNPVQVNSLALSCLDGTPEGTLTLLEAYIYGCPQPFVDALGSLIAPDTLLERFGVLGLLDPPRLAHFETIAGERPEPLTNTMPADKLAAVATGQDHLTVTPLQMMEIVAAVANGGNAVPLHLADSVRAPGEHGWQPLEDESVQPALLRTDIAQVLQNAMRQAAEISPCVRRAAQDNLVLYGHCAIAYGGPASQATPYAWFIGFAKAPGEDASNAVAVVVVLENESDPGAAADVAGAALAAGIQQTVTRNFPYNGIQGVFTARDSSRLHWSVLHGLSDHAGV